MDNNGVLSRLRYALNFSDAKVAALIRSSGLPCDDADVQRMLLDDQAEAYLPCPNEVLGGFLDALIVERRGPPPPGKTLPPVNNRGLTNNGILKKLRVAFAMSEPDVQEALVLGEITLSKPELRALFRSEGQPNFRACGDQVLRKFLMGLTRKLGRA